MQRVRQFLQEHRPIRVPSSQADTFAKYSAQQNCFRFMLLPYFNIITQFSCYVIYLYIYPSVYPDLPRLDRSSFTLMSVFYISVNIIFIFLFTWLHKHPKDPRFVTWANRATLGFVSLYVVMEGIETCLEVQISGNIYRFLATFFMVAFLPILPRAPKTLSLIGYAAVVQIGFGLLVRQGYIDVNRYREIVILFLIVCLILSHLVYNSTIKSFLLRQELIEANRRLRELSVTDPLTGTANRRAFDEHIRKVWSDCGRNGGTVFAIMLDVDWFKPYNDQYGHQKGDECLQLVSDLLMAHFRRSGDMVARYGGEEFVILLPYNTRESVMQLAEDVRAGIEALKIPHPHPASYGYITVSMGVSSMTPIANENGYSELIKQADDALYVAKNNGRNQVQAADSHVQTA